MSVLRGEQARQAMARMRQRAGEFAVHTTADDVEREVSLEDAGSTPSGQDCL
jgi:hypothetical protein